MARRQKPLIDRLLAKVVKLSSGCWFFCGTKNGAGYGTIGLGSREEGKGFAHRVSYELHNGPIPEGMVVCHSCDVKLCVNPEHLFLGTQYDNIKDMKSKGRGCSGERWHASRPPETILRGDKHGRSKLTEQDAIEIIRLFREECLNKTQIAKRFGITREMARNIINRRNWKHLEV